MVVAVYTFFTTLNTQLKLFQGSFPLSNYLPDFFPSKSKTRLQLTKTETRLTRLQDKIKIIQDRERSILLVIATWKQASTTLKVDTFPFDNIYKIQCYLHNQYWTLILFGFDDIYLIQFYLHILKISLKFLNFWYYKQIYQF